MKRKGFLKKALVYAMTGAIVASNVTPAYAYNYTNSTGSVNETYDTAENESSECEVYAELGSNFLVTIPKKITLDGAAKKGSYTVNVEGDIAGNEYIAVIPDKSFALSSANLASVTALISQDKTDWTYDEIFAGDDKVIGQGSISASGISAGAWNGSFNFNVKLAEQRFAITAVDESGTNLNATGAYILGSQKTILINKLVESGLIDNKDDVATLIDVQSDAFTGKAITTFDVSGIAKVGDIVTFYHYDETDGWEYIGRAVVNEDGTATGTFNSFSPVAITVERSENHTHSYDAGVVTKEATCTEAGVKTFTCYCGDSYTEDIPATGHSYGEVTYSWAEDNSTCTASRSCSECSEIESEEANSVSTVTTEATCGTDGVMTYTATFENTDFEEQTTTGAIPATGHNYVNGICTVCNAQEAGLYDAEGIMLCTWEESGIDVGINYGWASYFSNYYQTTPTSGYYVLTNNYPTATKVIIPDSVSSIGNCAFEGCTGLTSITIPSSVTSIGKYAFYNCTSLTSIEIPEGVTSIRGKAFYKTPWLTNQQANSENKLVIVNNILIDGTTASGNVTIPNSVTSIGNYAFDNCKNLTSVTIPNSVTSIEDCAFYQCTGLTSVTIPNSVTSIGGHAFYNCFDLTSINIPDSVTSIGGCAFFQSNLTSITIPSSVTSIGNEAFTACTRLPSINVDENNEKYCSVDGVLYNKDMTTLIAYPAGKTGTSYTIPSSVTSIEQQAFRCAKLTSVTIPEGVTSIKINTFFDCTNLTSITIPSSVTSIGSYAFYDCYKLTSITFKNTSGWYIGSSAGAKETSISSSNLANTSTAATYLKSTYYTKYWTRE